MKRSQFSKGFWFHEFDKVAFVIDLAHWGVDVKISKGYWSVRLLCFEVSSY